MILQFKPDVSAEQINDYLQSHKLDVIKTFPTIGAVQVETDLSPYFQPQLGDNNANQTTLRGLGKAIEHFQKRPTNPECRA